MIEILLFFISINLMVFILPVMWRKTNVDHYRDQLFDLREEVRRHFIKEGLGLDHPMYQNLRSLLNKHLRFLEDANIFKVIFLVRFISNNRILKENWSKINKLFESDDKELEQYAQDIRHQAVQIVMIYMIVSSMCLYFCAIVIAVLSFLKGRFHHFFSTIMEVIQKKSYNLSGRLFHGEAYLEEISFYYKYQSNRF